MGGGGGGGEGVLLFGSLVWDRVQNSEGFGLEWGIIERII